MLNTGSDRSWCHIRGTASHLTLGCSGLDPSFFPQFLTPGLALGSQGPAVLSPAWIVEAVGKHFGGLVGAVEVRVAPWDGIRHVAHVRVYVQPQDGTREVTEKLEDNMSAFAFVTCFT